MVNYDELCLCVEQIVVSGYFGDAMPVYSGTTSLIKTHGYFNTPVTNMRDLQSEPTDTEWMMGITRKTGIVLIRNPFRVLYSFRNYNVMGLYGHADASKFTGPGILTMNVYRSIISRITPKIVSVD